MGYIKGFIERHRYGPWKEVLIAYLIFCLIFGLCSAWKDRHFISSFVLWTVTNALYLPILISGMGTAIWIGVMAAKLSKFKALGWIAGIASFIGFSYVIVFVIGEIPGIGWRLLVIMDRSGSDY
ncbi:hypothetical protein AO069_23375 [Pseudomonas syringae pv. syringae PD2774]|uniref:hypothetical protein n=1 Tax=Pseudomonas syringae TaxID=317 RepID=UPI00073770D7|nr:hypothetical protein [Pseudomonas syringae]KTB84339.1 hypothetical protein AO069_23375 [Pseudomonas syringae pv. syringae PD2774]